MTDYTPPERGHSPKNHISGTPCCGGLYVQIPQAQAEPLYACEICKNGLDLLDAVEAAKRQEFIRIKTEAEAYAKRYPERAEHGEFLLEFFADVKDETFLSPPKDE